MDNITINYQSIDVTHMTRDSTESRLIYENDDLPVSTREIKNKIKKHKAYTLLFVCGGN